MKYIFRIGFFTVLLNCSAVFAETPDRPDVDAALDAYVEALEAGDAEKVVALYDKDAVFYSMVAVKPLKTQAERLAYYKKVVAEEDLAVDIDESESETTGNKATNIGHYTFHHTEEGEDIAMPAKFEFHYVLKNGKWLITEHRSTKDEAKKEQE